MTLPPIGGGGGGGGGYAPSALWAVNAPPSLAGNAGFSPFDDGYGGGISLAVNAPLRPYGKRAGVAPAITGPSRFPTGVRG